MRDADSNLLDGLLMLIPASVFIVVGGFLFFMIPSTSIDEISLFEISMVGGSGVTAYCCSLLDLAREALSLRSIED